MSAIGGIAGGLQPAIFNAAYAQKASAAAVSPVARDTDGDHDGTAPGQMDPKDFGKGVKVDVRA
jgi:hypothetical protein